MQEAIYVDLLVYISYLCDQEEDILRRVKNYNKTSDYRNIMGNTPICSLLLYGVKKSLSYTKNENNHDIIIALKHTEEKLILLQNKYLS